MLRRMQCGDVARSATGHLRPLRGQPQKRDPLNEKKEIDRACAWSRRIGRNKRIELMGEVRARPHGRHRSNYGRRPKSAKRPVPCRSTTCWEDFSSLLDEIER